MKITISPLVWFVCLSFLVGGCNALPVLSNIAQPEAETESTPVDSTIMLASPANPTVTADVPVAPSENTPNPTVAYSTPSASEENQIKSCDVIAPGQPIDVTISDGSRIEAGESFAKTWRLVNAGSCSWTEEYSVVWFSGQLLGPVREQRLSGETAPGEMMEITVDMVAPETPGMYQSNWKMRNADGGLFGLGPGGDAPFWVKVEVAQIATVTPFAALTAQASLAVYYSSTANLALNDRVDLDSGQANRAGEDDLAYMLDENRQPVLSPQNGARAAIFGRQAPVEADCQNAFLDSVNLVLSEPVSGIYLCYRTNQGLPGFLRLAQPAETKSSLSMDFITWAVP